MRTTASEENPNEPMDSVTAARHINAKTEELTVGYGDRYPANTVEGLVVADNNRACDISHEVAEYEIGYDLTLFFHPNGSPSRGADNFIETLQLADLHPVDDYVRVYRDQGRGTTSEYPDTYLHVWVNTDVLIGTTVNPITGMKDGDMNQLGTAGFMGIGGKEEAVRQIDAHVEAVGQIKDKEPNQMFY
jgi:hypothetical protein